MSKLSLISMIFALGLMASGCNLDPAEPVRADTAQETPLPSTVPPPNTPYLNPVPSVSSMQVQEAQERDPMMEQGARFMSIVNEHKSRLEENPKDKESLYFLGNANFDINRHEKAKDYYLRYLELDPDHPGVRTDLASIHYKNKDVEGAIRELNAVLEKKPDHPAALFNLGFILDSEGRDRKKAVELWQRLLLKHPDYARSDEVRQRIDEIKNNS